MSTRMETTSVQSGGVHARRRGAAAVEAPSRGARLLAEARWILGAVAVVALAAILITYQRADPGFSHTASSAALHNIGGRVGAWIADVLLLVFGVSAWLWVIGGAAWAIRGFRRLHAAYADRGLPDWLQGLGFVVLLVGSTGLEALRLYTLSVALPGAPGGILGGLIAAGLQTALGFTGATVLLLVAIALGASLYFDFSWLALAERVGAWFESLAQRSRASREEKEDRAIGEAVAQQREQRLEQERERIDEAPP
ncbi:MAG: DNA translocase FtsK 4TM domain-containing protein, partial [Gemmatimonadota bacterium]